ATPTPPLPPVAANEPISGRDAPMVAGPSAQDVPGGTSLASRDTGQPSTARIEPSSGARTANEAAKTATPARHVAAETSARAATEPAKPATTEPARPAPNERVKAAAAPSSTSGASADPRAEAQEIARAERMLSSDPAGALAIARRARARSGASYLAEERDYVEVMALQALGRSDEAR